MRRKTRFKGEHRSYHPVDRPLSQANNLLRLLVVMVLVLSFSVSLGQQTLAQDVPPPEPSSTPGSSVNVPAALTDDTADDVTTDPTDPPGDVTTTEPDSVESTDDPAGEEAPAESSDGADGEDIPTDPSVPSDGEDVPDEPSESTDGEETPVEPAPLEDDGLPPADEPSADSDATNAEIDDADDEFVIAALGAVTILKLNCAAAIDLSQVNIAGILAGIADPASLGCQLATGVDITATDPITGLTLGSATTVNGVAVIDGLTIGSQVVLTETVPVGYEPQGSPSRTITVTPLNVQLFVNVAVSGSPLAALIVIKLNCDAAIDLGSLDLGAIIAGTIDLLTLGCQLASNVAISVTDPLTGSTLAVGNTLNGLVTFTGLPADADVLIDEQAVVGFTPQNPGPHPITLLPGQNVDIFVNVNNNAGVTTDVDVTKLNCPASAALDPTDVLTGALGETDLLALGCVLADGVPFSVTDPVSGASLAAGVTVDGAFTAEGLSVGATVRISETVPAGYTAITPSQDLLIAPGTTALFVNQENPTAGTITVETVDSGGAPLDGACYALEDAAGTTIATACDADDGATDGTTVFEDVPFGSYEVVQTTTPTGYALADPVPVTITEAEPDEAVTVTNEGVDGSVTFTTVDESGAPLTEACYTIETTGGDTIGTVCDGDDGSVDGSTTLDGLAPGDYVAVQSTPPGGYEAASDSPFSISAADPDVTLTVTNSVGTGTVTIETVSAGGDALPGACYTIETADGTEIDTVCDADDGSSDGTTVVTGLTPGSYVAVQSTAPAGYDAVAPTPFTTTAAEPDAAITVTNTAGPGAIVITTVDPDGNPLPGACYEAQTPDGDTAATACDTDNDGTTTLDDLPLGPYDVVQVTPPAGYDPIDPVPVTLTVDDPEATITVTNDSGSGSITLETEDAAGDPLTDACYVVQTAGGTTIATVCDDDDGTSDGTTVIEDLPLGTFTVVQVTPPAGYQAADPETVTLTTDDPDATLTVTNDEGAGSVTVDTVDDGGNPLPGACYEVQSADGTVVGSACDSDGGPEDGTTTIPNVPPGSYDIVQTTPPGGYELADPIPVDVTPADLDPTVTVTNDEGAGSVTIETVDPNGDPLDDACYEIQTTDGTPVGTACDSDDGATDGATVVDGLAPGDYVAVQTTTPAGFDPASDTPFTITPEEPDAEITVVTGAAAGSVTIVTVDVDGNPLEGACYQIRTTGNSLIATACDTADGTVDGTTVIDNLPLGSYTAVQLAAPDGFDRAPNTPFTLTEDDPDAMLTVTNDAGAGSITIETVDAAGDPLVGVCYRIETAGGTAIATACDADDGTSDGITTVDDLPLASYDIIQTTAPVGYEVADPATATLTEADPDATVTVTNDVGAGTLTIETVDPDGNPLPGACYQIEVDGSPVAGPVCDEDDGANDGTTLIENLPPGDYVAVQTEAPEGYTPGEETPFTVTPEELDPTITVTNESGPGSITIDTVNGDGDALPGACYEAQTAEGTVIGAACDSDDGTNDGTVVIDDLPIRAYTVVQSTAPDGYALAAGVPVTLTTTDPDAEISVTNAVGLGSVTITTVNDDDEPIPGACYEIRTTDGRLAGTGCDDDAGPNDGVTVIDGLAPGSYVAVQVSAPDGYTTADPVPFSIAADALDAELTIANDAATGSVSIETRDDDGDPLPGACYLAQPASGAAIGPICDADDGANDGTTVLDDLPLGPVDITQTTTPDGYDPADPISVTLTPDEPEITVTVTNSESAGEPTGTVEVIFVDERNQAVPGVCIRIDDMVTVAAVVPDGTICDGDDGANDGVIVVDDLPLGTLTLTIASVPAGYVTPASVSVTLLEPGEVVSVTVEVPRGASTPGDGDGGSTPGAGGTGGSRGELPTSLPNTGAGTATGSPAEQILPLVAAIALLLMAIAARAVHRRQRS